MNTELPTPTRAQVFDRLAEMGVATVEMEFSGGNDEGGVDVYSFLDADGKVLPQPFQNVPSISGHYTWDGDTSGIPAGTPVVQEYCGPGRHSLRRATPAEIELRGFADALEQPIYSEYGSFAGEFSVYGVLTWNVKARTVHMNKHEQSGYNDFDYEV